MTTGLRDLKGARGPIFAIAAGLPQVSAALCCHYCACATIHEPVCHPDTALSDFFGADTINN